MKNVRHYESWANVIFMSWADAMITVDNQQKEMAAILPIGGRGCVHMRLYDPANHLLIEMKTYVHKVTCAQYS